MFIGHYGPAVWDAHRTNGVRLWHGFLAVQAMDYMSMIFNLIGLEGGDLPDGAHPLAFDIPWSHSLLSAIVIAVAAAGLYRLLRPSTGRKAILIIGLLAFSHWPLDWLVHRPDLPLYPGGEMMLGLGLWNYAWPAYLVEVGLLGTMMAWWLSVTKGPLWTTIGAWILVAVMSFLQHGLMTAPTLAFQETGAVPPPASPALAVAGLIIFSVFAGVIAFLESRRSVVQS